MALPVDALADKATIAGLSILPSKAAIFSGSPTGDSHRQLCWLCKLLLTPYGRLAWSLETVPPQLPAMARRMIAREVPQQQILEALAQWLDFELILTTLL